MDTHGATSVRLKARASATISGQRAAPSAGGRYDEPEWSGSLKEKMDVAPAMKVVFICEMFFSAYLCS